MASLRHFRPAHLLALALVQAALACGGSDLPVAIGGEAGAPRRMVGQADGTPLVLRGTILTPDGVIKHGYVGVVAGRIVSVSAKQPGIPGAVTINTEGILAPGFVDVHNHLPWNVLPRWSAGRAFTNRSQWRTDPDHVRLVAAPFHRLAGAHFCDMNAWGELRALVGGTTSGMTTQPVPCIHGLVRNLDWNSGFYGTTQLGRERVYDVLELPPASDPVARAGFVGAAWYFIGDPAYEALAMHVAEGTDEAAAEEFAFLRSQGLLNPKGVVIHGIPLGAGDFQAMAASGTALVWSPRSNLELYERTADVGAALDAGVEIALAPDWAITGSGNMLDELKVAARWNAERLGGRLTDRQLLGMATSAAARIVGVDDEVGEIRVGLRADLLVIGGNHADPYRPIVEATAEQVRLVVVGGVPLYGDRALLERAWSPAELEELPVGSATKSLATPAAGVSVADVAGRLRAALAVEGTSLAPLTEAAGGGQPALLLRGASVLPPR
jgi:hypothetical protein